jgi:hypothetical protein
LLPEPIVGEMALTMLAVDHANKFLHEGRVVLRIMMATARSAEIIMRANARPDACVRMTNWNLQMMAQIREHARRGCEQRRIQTAIREATYLDAYRASIESAHVPGLVGEVDHLRRLTAVLANDVVCRAIRPAHFEPSDGALYPPSQSCNTMRSTLMPRLLEKLGDGLQTRIGRKSVIGRASFAPYAVAACKKTLRWGERTR